jgi:23S rRNA (cytidine1920-2'-O)/16S rRNA (cytidine1409-2'-O)-methyltransferase
LIVADLSFISLATVAPVLAQELAGPAADLVFLIKPQFEAGAREASRGRGVIRDPVVWARVLVEVGTALSGARAAMMGIMVSPLTGASGNVEFLAHFRAHAPASCELDPSAIDSVVAEATGR